MKTLLERIKKLENVLLKEFEKIYKIQSYQKGKTKIVSGTLEYLIDYFNYTLRVGNARDSKIQLKPSTIKSLISNLNKSIELTQPSANKQLKTRNSRDHKIDSFKLIESNFKEENRREFGIGDQVGNTVIGFDFKVIKFINNEFVLIKHRKTGKELGYRIEGLYKPTRSESHRFKENLYDKDSIELVCGFNDAKLIPEVLRDTRIDRKLGFKIEATSTTSWGIELNEYEGTAKELIDELTEVFNEYGCDDFEFKY